MGNELDPSLFMYKWMFRKKSKTIKAERALAVGETHVLVAVKGQAGRLDSVQVVVEDDTNSYLKITLDDRVIFNHSHTMIEDDGSGKLSVPLLYGLALPYGVTRTDAGGYGIMFNGAAINAEFRDDMTVEIVNRGTAADVINAYHVIYGILTLYKRRKD